MSWPALILHSRGNKIGQAIKELHHAENALHRALLALADAHATDHGVHFVALDVARWSRQHVRELARIGGAYEMSLAEDADSEPTLLARARRTTAELTGRFHDPSMVLLADLRSLHRRVAGVSLDWEVLAQTAQATQDADLLGVAQRCHPETLRQMQWTNAVLKEIAAQTMVTP